MNEFTLEDFRKIAKVGRTNNARGFLSGARHISAVAVRWTSKAGKRELHFSKKNGRDYVKDCFDELQKNCLIRDCLIPAWRFKFNVLRLNHEPPQTSNPCRSHLWPQFWHNGRALRLPKRKAWSEGRKTRRRLWICRVDEKMQGLTWLATFNR